MSVILEGGKQGKNPSSKGGREPRTQSTHRWHQLQGQHWFWGEGTVPSPLYHPCVPTPPPPPLKLYKQACLEWLRAGESHSYCIWRNYQVPSSHFFFFFQSRKSVNTPALMLLFSREKKHCLAKSLYSWEQDEGQTNFTSPKLTLRASCALYCCLANSSCTHCGTSGMTIAITNFTPSRKCCNNNNKKVRFFRDRAHLLSY